MMPTIFGPDPANAADEHYASQDWQEAPDMTSKNTINDMILHSIDNLEMLETVLIDKLLDLQFAHKVADEALFARKAAERAVHLKYADDPKSLGANEAVREARIAELCANERIAERNAERAMRDADDAVELAQLRYDTTRRCLSAWQSIARLAAGGEE